MKTIQPKIGEGIFLTKDVSEILHLPYQKVRRWMLELWDKSFGEHIAYSFGEKRNKAINFLTLIEFYTFFQLKEQGMTSFQIKKAHTIIGGDLQTNYPFATSLRTNGKRIWYEYLDYLVKADAKQQYDIKSFIDPFLKKIDFGQDNFAERYYPLKDSRNVVVDPKHQFGQPTISGTNIATDFVYKLIKGGETEKNICILYDINVNQVADAILYQKQIA